MSSLVRVTKPGHDEHEVDLRRAVELERFGWQVVEPEPAVDLVEQMATLTEAVLSLRDVLLSTAPVEPI